MNRVPKPNPDHEELAQAILDTALSLAELRSWEELHLYDIADSLDIRLDQILNHYLQKDDLVEAWFDRADRAVLRMENSPHFFRLSPANRLQHVIMHWFDALSPHHAVTRQMLRYKLEFGHIHLQALGIMRISRTVQWFREAARLETVNLFRAFEETGLTAIYLRAFGCWMYDDSRNFEKTRHVLQNNLSRAERIISFFDVLRD